MSAQHTPGPKSLRELALEASGALDLYRSPDIEEAQTRLGEVFRAAGKGNFHGVVITGIDFSGDWVSVSYEWSSRGCPMSDTDTIPARLLDEADPIKAATLWRLGRELAAAESGVQSAEAGLRLAHERLAAARAAIAKATGSAA